MKKDIIIKDQKENLSPVIKEIKRDLKMFIAQEIKNGIKEAIKSEIEHGKFLSLKINKNEPVNVFSYDNREIYIYKNAKFMIQLIDNGPACGVYLEDDYNTGKFEGGGTLGVFDGKSSALQAIKRLFI